MQNRLCEMFGIEFPIFAFTHCRDVAAAVSRAGGLGVLGALAFSPDQLEIELQWIDEHVDGKPYGVDIVMPVKSVDREAGLSDAKNLATDLYGMISKEHWDYADKILADHGIPELPEEEQAARDPLSQGVLGWTEATGAPLTDIALAHPIKLLAERARPAAARCDRAGARAGRQGRRADRPRRAGGARRAAGRRHHHRPGVRGGRPHRRGCFDGAGSRRGRRDRARAGAGGRRHRQRSPDGRGDGARRRRRVDGIDLDDDGRVGLVAGHPRQAAARDVDRHGPVAAP